jgi:hypothetical protein
MPEIFSHSAACPVGHSHCNIHATHYIFHHCSAILRHSTTQTICVAVKSVFSAVYFLMSISTDINCIVTSNPDITVDGFFKQHIICALFTYNK